MTRSSVGEGHCACLVTPFTYEYLTESEPRRFALHTPVRASHSSSSTRDTCAKLTSHPMRPDLQLTHKGTDVTFNSALCDVAKLTSKQMKLGDIYKQSIDAVKVSRAP
ncbi:hypothetical protein N5P37_002183 [Trichoderma harzianum]|nr:hypothetical protein N5P37_002183 [Trichoderma harzianum]